MKSGLRNYPRWRHAWDHLYWSLTRSAWPARLAWRLYPHLDIGVERHSISVATPLGQRDVLRIAFASDFHTGPVTPWPLLEKSIAALRDLRADLLLLGGDFVSLRANHAAPLASLLARLPAPLGRYAVLGNHDHWAGAAGVANILERAGIEMLTNRCVSLPPPFENVSICGLDDYTSGHPDAVAAFAGAKQIRVLLMHGPSGLLNVDGRHFTVAMCGHTHGGQIALPNERPVLVAHGPLSRQYNAGEYALPDGGTLLVSRGIGYGTLPIRVNAPSSVLLCSIVHSGTADGG